ncbi:MAG: hypothetical protein Q8P18_05730 [Pseudomonadota bacterium]|nr:hypothetical protein [Pseudomonadota bacterium]
MARNNISLSITPLDGGKYKIRWREDVVEDGLRVRKARSQVVTDKSARDALVGKLRRTLESGDVYEPAARVVTTAANLERAALNWLAWQSSRDRKKSTRSRYKSAIARIMGTVRKVRRIADEDVIPVSVLDVNLFTELRNKWIAEDEAAGSGTKGRKPGACGPLWRYHLSGHLFSIWSYCASQPVTYPGIPPLVDRELVIPPVPRQKGAPTAPTWAECDAVIRRAYDVSEDLGDVLAGERLTGLRVFQVTGIRRRAVDPVRATLTVEVGKSAAEEAEMRTVPIPRSLVDAWQTRIAACKSPDDYLFATDTTASGHVEPDTNVINELWAAAEKAGEVRPNVARPLHRRKARPNHAFRAAYMSELQGITVEVDGAPVHRVSDRTIDYLVGHAAIDTRGQHYARPSDAALVAAVGLVAPIDMKPEAVDTGNVVPIR